jgi:hypothetical protein
VPADHHAESLSARPGHDHAVIGPDRQYATPPPDDVDFSHRHGAIVRPAAAERCPIRNHFITLD